MDTTQIYISNDLKNVLEQIQDNSIIARLMLQGTHLKGDLPEDHINYLSISESDSTKISYLSPDRFQKIQKEGRDVWGPTGRIYGRPGSVVSKLFNLDGGRDVELFNNLYKAALSKVKYDFKIVSGDDIRKYYHQDTYYSSSGSLGNSCMKYDNCQKFFTLYTSNPTVISMLIMLDPCGAILGRSLLWNFDSYKVMDRIYTVNDEQLSYQFKKWAIDNGYMYKHEQKWNTTLQFELSGKKFDQKFSVTLPNWDCERYPYLDTFKFLDKKVGTLYNYIPHSGVRTLSAPDGSTFDGNVYCLDHFTNIFHHPGETVSIRYLDGRMQETEDIRSFSGNVEWSNVNDMHILKKDAIFSEEYEDFIFIPDLDHLNNKKNLEERLSYLAQRRIKHQGSSDWLTWIPIDDRDNEPIYQTQPGQRERYFADPAEPLFDRLARLGGRRRPGAGLRNVNPINPNIETTTQIIDELAATASEEPAISVSLNYDRFSDLFEVPVEETPF